jgi:diguanylate cyclase (GGDEF)-like protein
MAQTVLIIDDSQDVHDLLSVRLRAEDLVLHHVLDAKDGISRAWQLRPDLVLLDVDMPDIAGFEVCQLLKRDPRTVGTPVIFLTATDSIEQKVRGFEIGAVDYVTKPFEPAELRARVRAALRTKRYQDLLESRANIDALTTLWNRSYLDQLLQHELAASRRYGRTVGLVLLDVDHFKLLNDDFGHPFGDFVLQRVGELLWGLVRNVDVPCRYGGEEFAIVMTDTDGAGATIAAERIRRELANTRFVHRAKLVPVTASFGVAATDSLIGPARLTADALVESADAALYEAKHAGRNRVCTSALPEPALVAAG